MDRGNYKTDKNGGIILGYIMQKVLVKCHRCHLSLVPHYLPCFVDALLTAIVCIPSALQICNINSVCLVVCRQGRFQEGNASLPSSLRLGILQLPASLFVQINRGRMRQARQHTRCATGDTSGMLDIRYTRSNSTGAKQHDTTSSLRFTASCVLRK